MRIRNLFLAIGMVLSACLTMLADAREWKVHSIDTEGKGADGVRFADVNNDGFLDIASGWEEAGESRAYLHPGPDKVRQPWPKVVVGKTGPVEDAVFADLDGDGAAEVVSSSENRKIYVHWAPKDGDTYLEASAWKTEFIPASEGVHNWMITAPLQLDGKNGPDLLAAGKGNNVYWFESPADPRELSLWKMHKLSDKAGWMMGFLPVDMDLDGDQDLLVGVRNGNPGVRWFENPGHGLKQRESWKAHEVGKPGSMGFVATGDLDQDGNLDVVASVMGEKRVRIFRGLGKDATRWETIDIIMPNSKNKGIAIGDIDLDGRDDLVVSYEYAEIFILKNDGQIGTRNWTREKVASGGKFDDVTLYDVDLDGDLDIFTTDEKGLQVLWYENPKTD